MYILFSTGFTIVMVPYNALLPDMVEDYVVRSRFSGTRIICSTFGAIIAGLIPTLIIKDNTNAASYFTVAIIFSVIFFLVILLTFLGTWEKQKKPVKISFSQSFVQSLTVFKSKSFQLFILIFLAGQGAADFVTGLAVYYIDDVLNAYGGGRFTYLMGVILVSQFIGTIFFSIIMPKTSKKFPLLFGFPIRIAATLILLAFSYEGANFSIILALTFFIGFGMAGSSTTIYAILADMADIDELITSINRPGTVSAMATFCRKIATGLSTTIIGIFLAIAGYDEVIAAAGGRQSAATQRGIAYLYIFLPVVLMLVALIATRLFPVTQKEFNIVKTEIARRKGEDQSTATAEEIAVCEKVTGYRYDELWNPARAYRLKVD
jgi:oligogalacturonide transporter